MILVYWNAIDGPFVLDDNDSVVRNRRIQVGDLSPVSSGGALFAPPYVRRPLPNLTLALNYWAGGLSTRGYHLVNVAVHCMAALAMYWFLSRLLRDAQIARARCGGNQAHLPQSSSHSRDFANSRRRPNPGDSRRR